MNQLKERKCIRCKQVLDFYVGKRYCETCVTKNCEEKFGKCIECGQMNTEEGWCQTCNSKRFQQSFSNWTSGNDDIDKLIQNTQLSARNYFQLLEWIPYDRFSGITYVAEGGFGKVHKASWKDGYILRWDFCKNQWKRHTGINPVALKSLNNSQNVTLEFINEVYSCELIYYI
jgi:hypothetical protein